MLILSLIFGAIVGFSLGLTGGGGSIFAVPLLVYGLSVAPREAVGVSLAAVGMTALVGTIDRLRAGQVELRTGLIFAAAGMLGAPIGSLLAGWLSEAVLLALFALLMLLIAGRMWFKASVPQDDRPARQSTNGPACRRDVSGNLQLTSRCGILLTVAGLGTGILSGLFGVGGGFVIVPALVLFSRMDIRRAIATSLLVISLVSVAGVSSHLIAGRTLSMETTLLFVAGGVAGMFLGHRIGRHLSGPILQRVFAVAIVAVAVFVIRQTMA